MTSCSSSISVQKSSKSVDQRSKSCDTVCTSNSSCFLQRRKPMNPLMYTLRPNYKKNSGNSVRQRVLSAKLLKLRSIQNQLNDANFHLSELSKENQILKNLQKRQDKALTKYEGMNEDLPRLIHSHEEQMRVLTERNKSLKKTVKELNEILKCREEELAKVHEKLNHLEKLNRDKHLVEREKLMDQLEDTKLKLQKSDEQVSFLNRKLMLESKTSKQRLNAEMVKHKECQKELNQALTEIDRLTGLLETKENMVHPRRNRFSRLAQRQSVSMVSLGNYQPQRIPSCEKLATIKDLEETTNKTPVTDVKLEPIKCKSGDRSKKVNGILDIPSENIRNRLSSASTRRDSMESLNNIKEHSSGSEISLDTQENSSGSSEIKTRTESTYKLSDSPENNKHDRNRPTSNTKLQKLTKTLDEAIQRATENSTDEFDRKLGDYCSDIVSNVRNCNERIEAHKESIKISKKDTNILLETFTKTKKMESTLQNSLLNFEEADVDFIKDILTEELKFQMNNKEKKPLDKNGRVPKKEPVVNLEDKKKLLATLKAIDNGDSFDSVDNSPPHGQTNLIREIFGDLSK